MRIRLYLDEDAMDSDLVSALACVVLMLLLLLMLASPVLQTKDI
jgi:hypothetical protein